MREESAWREFLDKRYPYRTMTLFWIFIMLSGVSSALWLAWTLKKWPYPINELSPFISLVPIIVLFFIGIALEIRVENKIRKEFENRYEKK